MAKKFNIHDWQAKQRLEEHHAGDYKPGFLKQTVSKFLDKLKKKNEADYNKVEKIMEKYFSALCIMPLTVKGALFSLRAASANFLST